METCGQSTVPVSPDNAKLCRNTNRSVTTFYYLTSISAFLLDFCTFSQHLRYRMLNRYGTEKEHNLPGLLTRNHSDSVPANLTVDLSELFSVQFSQQVNQVQRISHVHHNHPELMIGDTVECLLEVHKAHIGLEWLLVLACFLHQYSENVYSDLISSPLPFPYRNPACSCAISVSVFIRVLSSMIQRRILLSCETRAIVL